MSDQQGFEYRFKQQVELLNRRNGFFSQSILDEKIEALDEIGKHATPSDVQYLLTYVFSGNKFIAQKAAETIRILLTDNEVQRIDWLGLYETNKGQSLIEEVKSLLIASFMLNLR